MDRDHPRVCGEQPILDRFFAAIIGSPPRVRGTGYSKKIIYSQNRITPACAGNSCTTKLCNNWRKDHPRVCGEQKDD